ncbi:MAG TPA: asparagine synthase (glutamine-hydrolyzing), partial [Candidatus Dormibacteraeota bacterium]|nr:asparagine synthase (glutamine-hydrolyzing) [Candidatus Dormibacteraeota bacterium]
FAIAIWDSRERKLVLARDRVGKKPLFYAEDSEHVTFASELKALLTDHRVSREMDMMALSDYFSLGYIPAPKTIYRAVRKILPGHYRVFTVNGSRQTSFWDLSFAETDRRTEEEWCEILRHELSDATRVRLLSDVPLSAFLSGGVDSSAVVAMMARLMKRPVSTCSIGVEEQEFNELDHSRLAARHFNTNHQELMVRPDAVEVVGKLAWHFDEPFGDSSAIPTYYVSKVARQFVTVALGGDGGDENFAGYRRYAFDCLENRLRDLCPDSIRSPIFGRLGSWYPGLAWAPRAFRAKATFQNLGRSPLEGYFNSISVFRPDEKPQLFNRDVTKMLAGYDTLQVLQSYYDRADTQDSLSKIQYVDIKTYLPDDILTKVDRASMAVSLEVRAPLLDHKLMELAARVPSWLKLRHMKGKYIFKKAMRGIVPDEILTRKKQGFVIPLNRWFRKELKDMAEEMLFDEKEDLLDTKYLRRIWSEHQNGTRDRAAHLWCVLMFRQWQNTFRTVPLLARMERN